MMSVDEEKCVSSNKVHLLSHKDALLRRKTSFEEICLSSKKDVFTVFAQTGENDKRTFASPYFSLPVEQENVRS